MPLGTIAPRTIDFLSVQIMVEGLALAAFARRGQTAHGQEALDALTRDFAVLRPEIALDTEGSSCKMAETVRWLATANRLSPAAAGT